MNIANLKPVQNPEPQFVPEKSLQDAINEAKDKYLACETKTTWMRGLLAFYTSKLNEAKTKMELAKEGLKSRGVDIETKLRFEIEDYKKAKTDDIPISLSVAVKEYEKNKKLMVPYTWVVEKAKYELENLEEDEAEAKEKRDDLLKVLDEKEKEFRKGLRLPGI